MAICGCGSPARCCQPAVAGGIIYADLESELNTHLTPQALFTQISPGCDATATSFPLSKHTGGGDTASAFSGQHVYLQLMWEVGRLPSPVEFSSHLHFYKLSCSWLLGGVTTPAFFSWVIYLQFHERLPLPPLALRVPRPLCCLSFLLLLLIIQFFFLFSLGRGRSVQGAMLIWPRVVCGSTVYCLAHLVVRVFPSCLGAGIWQQCGSPPGFSFQHGVGILHMDWGCGGVKVLPLLGAFSYKVYLQCLSKILLYETCFPLPPSSCHLGISTKFRLFLSLIYFDLK
jgi:hypothetical protein